MRGPIWSIRQDSIKMKIPGLPNKSYSRSDAAQIAAKKYKTSATRIYQIWKMQGEIKQQPLRGARAHWLHSIAE